MNAQEYIGDFSNAIQTVIESLVSKPFEKKELHFSATDCGNDLLVVIGLIGDISGSFYMSMDLKTAKMLASELLGGMEIEDGINELTTSAVSELGNMIMGAACSNIAGNGIVVDITPPTVVTGDRITYGAYYTICRVPIAFNDYGEIGFDLAIKSA